MRHTSDDMSIDHLALAVLTPSHRPLPHCGRQHVTDWWPEAAGRPLVLEATWFWQTDEREAGAFLRTHAG